VFQLGIALGVPRSILTARPSPDLWGVGDQHNDEEEIASYLGLKGCGIPFYSYVDVETGAYKNVGLIERLHRFCDGTDGKAGEVLFGDSSESLAFLSLNEVAPRLSMFANIPENVVTTLLTNARRVEAATRHKMNPNCPALGDRASLVKAGILTNELPV